MKTPSASASMRKSKALLLLGAALILAAPALRAADLRGNDRSRSWARWNLDSPSDFLLGSYRAPRPQYEQSPGAPDQTSLIVDQANGNSPFTFSSGAMTYFNIFVGNSGIGVLNQNGGTITVTNALILGVNAGSNGTYNLNGGTLLTPVATAFDGASTFNFNGGTLRAAAGDDSGGSGVPFFFGFDRANIRNGGAIVDSNGFNISLVQVLSHSNISGDNAIDGGLTKNGAGMLTLTAFNNYTGNTRVNAGTLNITSGQVGVTGSTATFTVNGTASAAATALLGNSAVLKDATTFIGTDATGVFTQTGGTHTVSGALFLGFAGSQATTGVGTYNLSGGALQAIQQFQLGNYGTGTVNQTGGAASTDGGLFLGLNGGTGTYNLSGTGTLDTASAIVGFTGNGAVIGTGVFTQTGGTHTTGNLELGQSNGSNGTYHLNGGTASTGRVRGGAGIGLFNFNGGTLRATANDGNIGNTSFFTGLTRANVRTGGAIIDTNGFSVTATSPLLHSNIAGDNTIDGGLTKDGAGTLKLTGVNTYTGATQVNAGTLAITAGGVGQGTQRGNFTVNGISSAAATATLSGSALLNDDRTLIGTDAVGFFNQSGGTHTTSGLVLGTMATGNGTYTLRGGNLTTSTAVIGAAGTGTFTQTGGTFTETGFRIDLGADSGSSGTYNLSNGTLQLDGNDGNGTSLLLGFFGSGTVNQSGGSLLASAGLVLGAGVNGSSGTYNLSGGLLQIGGGAIVGLNGTGVFTQSAGIFTIVSGGLELSLRGVNGTYNLDGGLVSTARVVGGSGNNTFNFNGGILQASAGDGSIGGSPFFSDLRRVNVRNGGASIDTNGFNVTAASPLLHSNIAGDNAIDGGLTKSGAGDLTLAGANTYTGDAAVSAGRLLVNGSTVSGAVVNGGTLGGSGVIGGNVTINAGGALAPGNSPGQLTINGNLTLASNGTFVFELGGTTAGSGYDQVVVGGQVSLAGNLQVSVVNGFSIAIGQTFYIIDQPGTGVPPLGMFANAPGGVYTDAAGNTYAVNYAAMNPGSGSPGFNDVSLTVLAVVPEPATWSLLLGGAAMLAVVGYRKRRVRG